MAESVGSKVENDFEYSYPTTFERNFPADEALQWYQENWQLGFVITAAYVILIFLGQRYMNKKHKYELRTVLAIWNGILALFSFITSIRLCSELYYVITIHGWDSTVCSPTVYFGHSSLWAFLFATSKAYELGDTAFIVLRKQPLLFLHWYHHVTVLIYSWYTYAYFYAPGRWFATVNCVVHSIMYTYYMLRALQYRFPKWINISITSTQLLQMVVGIFVNIHAYNVLNRGGKCYTTKNNIKYSLLMYFSYFLLFAHFFYGAYLKPKTSVTKPASNGHVKQDTVVTKNGYYPNGVYHKYKSS